MEHISARCDVSHPEHGASRNHKAIHSLSITFHSIKYPLASLQRQRRDPRAVPVCYEACCQTWQGSQATLNPSHQRSSRVVVSAESAFQSSQRGRRRSCSKAAHTAHLLKKPSWQEREIPAGNTEGKAVAGGYAGFIVHILHGSSETTVFTVHTSRRPPISSLWGEHVAPAQ